MNRGCRAFRFKSDIELTLNPHTKPDLSPAAIWARWSRPDLECLIFTTCIFNCDYNNTVGWHCPHVSSLPGFKCPLAFDNNLVCRFWFWFAVSLLSNCKYSTSLIFTTQHRTASSASSMRKSRLLSVSNQMLQMLTVCTFYNACTVFSARILPLFFSVYWMQNTTRATSWPC